MAAKAPFEVGDRIRMVQMHDDPDPIAEGTFGTVVGQRDLSGVAGRVEVQLDVDWDNGRTLAVLWPIDKVVKVGQ